MKPLSGDTQQWSRAFTDFDFFHQRGLSERARGAGRTTCKSTSAVGQWPNRRERLIALDWEDTDGFVVDRAYRDHGRALFGFMRNSLGDVGSAEDAVQETFLRAHRARGTYRTNRGSERTWLFAIARNVATDHLRARSRRPREVQRTERDGDEPVSGGQEVVLDRLLLTQAMAVLTPEHREVISAVHLENWTYQSLSEATGVPVGTLRTRMYYGMRALRAAIEEVPDERA